MNNRQLGTLASHIGENSLRGKELEGNATTVERLAHAIANDYATVEMYRIYYKLVALEAS